MTFYNITHQISKIKKNEIYTVVESLTPESVENIFSGIRERKRIYHLHPLLQLYLIQIAGGLTDRSTVSKGINQGLLQPQKKGCGFPVMNMCVLMGLESGGIIDVETIAGTGYEHPLFRLLWRSLEKGDIILGDALYGSYAEVALLQIMGVDCVFRKGTKKFKHEDAVELDNGDWLYHWKRPVSPGKWIDSDELPESIVVRVIHAVINRKGFRSKNVTIYTTLLDTDEYTRDDLLELYRRRWDIELRFRDIKTTMGFEMLRSKCPSACRRELWAGILLYNLIRTIMLDAALQYKVCMARLSFKGAIDRFAEMMSGLYIHLDPWQAYQLLIRNIALDINPDRPFRIEPRKLKQRPKNYRLLNIPRKLERKLIEIGYTA